MKNILIPTDFSENSWNAIRYALRFFENSQCNFFLMHVNRIHALVSADSIYIESQSIEGDVDNEVLVSSEKHLQKVLKRINKLVSNPKHHFKTINTYAVFVEAIRQAVKEHEIDYIVMGTKGASGIKKLVIGSNTGDVITKVACSILVVPENASYVPPKEIAFPTDFSLLGKTKIMLAISELLQEFQASLRLVHVSKRKAVLTDEQKTNLEFLKSYFTHNSHSIHFLTNTYIEDAIECFVQSRNINMIVMVAKNLNYFQRILFHPTIEKISYHTDIPFLVLHEK